MFCSNCGKELPDGSAFCKFCGTKLKAAPGQAAQQPMQQPYQQTMQQAPYWQPVQQPPYQPPRTRKIKLLPLALAAVLAIAVLALLPKLFDGGKGDGSARQEQATDGGKSTSKNSLENDPDAYRSEAASDNGKVIASLMIKGLEDLTDKKGATYNGYHTRKLYASISRSGDAQFEVICGKAPSTVALQFYSGDTKIGDRTFQKANKMKAFTLSSLYDAAQDELDIEDLKQRADMVKVSVLVSDAAFFVDITYAE